MFIHAAFTPHPPIIVPEIGGDNIKRVQATIAAMEKLAESLAKSAPDTLLVISPHGPVNTKYFNINNNRKLAGDFALFGHPEMSFPFNNDTNIVRDIEKLAARKSVPLATNNDPALDHGVLVPLYFLAKHLRRVRVVPINYAGLALAMHTLFGQIIRDAAHRSKNKVALIASGDLSHGLTADAPAGFAPRGKEFDEKIVKLLRHNDTAGITHLDSSLVDSAAECGFRSLLILLGALTDLNYAPEILSYEGPFGVGYLVANFELTSY